MQTTFRVQEKLFFFQPLTNPSEVPPKKLLLSQRPGAASCLMSLPLCKANPGRGTGIQGQVGLIKIPPQAGRELGHPAEWGNLVAEQDWSSAGKKRTVAAGNKGQWLCGCFFLVNGVPILCKDHPARRVACVTNSKS